VQAAVLVMVFHFLSGDLFITSWEFPDEETCLEAAQNPVEVPPGTIVVEQCVVSTDQET
jgi:hypothetical protein